MRVRRTPASTADNRFSGGKFHRKRTTPARWAAFFAAHWAGTGAAIRAGNMACDPGVRAGNGPARPEGSIAPSLSVSVSALMIAPPCPQRR